jgi:hypothetical protein
MPSLDKKLFAGTSEIDPGDYEKLEIKNLTSEILDKLTEHGWAGETAGCVCLLTSADNERIERGYFAAVGPLGEYREDASKVWQSGNARATLVIKLSNANVFTFSEGGLVSDIVPQEKIEHCLYVSHESGAGAPSVMLEAEYEEFGIKGFCLKMMCSLSKNSSVKNGVLVKYSVLLFPLEKDELLEKFDAAQHAAWPGMKVSEGELPLLIKARTPWGCPIWPLILTGTSLEQAPQLPRGDELRSAISHIMTRGALPETSKSASNLAARWRRLAANADELVTKQGNVDWPKAQQKPNETGKLTYINISQ